ncbi:MAG TPA: dihydrofolate reductase family protein [Bacteroidota bacterium]|nr:dihydrofolate reductase family protein [Bacteroidota bacterium]
MRRLIFAINITVDGFCDHTTVIADDELHEYYTELLRRVDTVVFGRITYELMASHWPSVAKNGSGTKAENEFAKAIDRVNKVVFSKTLKNVEWKNARISRADIQEEILTLKQQSGKDISLGGLSIASSLTQLGLIDEYLFVVQPIVAGKGKRLFESTDIRERVRLKLVNSKTFQSGVVALHYKKD